MCEGSGLRRVGSLETRLSPREYIELAPEYWRYSDVAIFGMNILRETIGTHDIF